MPGCMFQRVIDVAPATGIIHKNHQRYCSAAEDIEGIEAFHYTLITQMTRINANFFFVSIVFPFVSIVNPFSMIPEARFTRRMRYKH